jgi:hypothetical protein
VLIRLGMANEWQLTAARAAQWGVPVLGKDFVVHPVETDIPVSLLRAYSAAPLHHSAATNRLLLGFAHRVEHSFLVSLEAITGCRAEPCCITPSAYADQLTRLTAIPDCIETVFEDSLTPAQMANNLAGAAVDISVREATFAHSRNLVWVRLTGKRRKVDVLFRGKIDSEQEQIGKSVAWEDRITRRGVDRSA